VFLWPSRTALTCDACQVSPTGEMFTVVTASKKILVYRVATGRRCAEVDESLEIVHESQKHSNVSNFNSHGTQHARNAAPYFLVAGAPTLA
jgi:hypothetical protein